MSSKQFTAKTFAWLRQINRGRYHGIDVKVAVELTEYFNEKDEGGRAFPSYKRIGDQIGVSEQTVIRSIDRLRKGGELYVIPGRAGRGYPNQYWMTIRAEQKTSTQAEVLAAGKPPRKAPGKPRSEAEKTSIAVEENHCRTTKNPSCGSQEASTKKVGEKVRASREEESIPLPAGTPPLSRHPAEDPSFATARPPAGKDQKEAADEERIQGADRAETDATSESVAREEIGGAVARIADAGAWLELRELWRRGWASDDSPKAIAIAKAAFERACQEVAPGEILEAARTWVAAADAPRYLPALAQWLAAKGWEQPPPRRKARGRGGGRASAAPHGGKPDMFRITLEAGGYREDADGNMYWPGDVAAVDDEPLCTSMWSSGGGR